MKSAVVIGGTGLIGRKLTESLLDEGYNVKILSRDKSKIEKIFGNSVIPAIWNGHNSEELASIINGSDILINLTGHSIAVPWSKPNKVKIWNSRVGITARIATAINLCKLPSKVFVQASAVGFYNHNSTDRIDEDSPKGIGFLSKLTAEWEKQAMRCSPRTRVVIIRTGIVLSNAGGFLPKILKPLKLYLGAILGSGKQIIPWIHIDDHVSAIKFLINSNANGAFNLVSPNPVSFSNLTKVIAKRVQRPVLFRIPSFILKLALGSMANEVLLSSQNVEPKKLKELGFEWKFLEIENALNDLIPE
ncbi:epimerase [Tenuifilaceae bacterium CYCD]|nr:epimerase [Tenuifilaceae bacterium CYCD]